METDQMTKPIIDFFNNNPVLNILSLLLAILGIIFTSYFYFKSKKNKKPTYIIRTVNLVREKIQKIDTVEILYSGEKINNLSISKLAFWNDGKETINSTDVAQNNPMRVEIENEYQILDAEILFQKNDANDFKINISNDNKSITITFDYLDFEEGIVLQLFHTANSSEVIKLVGKIKSVKHVTRREFSNSIFPSIVYKILLSDILSINRSRMRAIMGWTILIVGIIACFLPFFITILKESIPATPKDINDPIWIAAIPGLLYIYLGYRMLKRRIPKGFDIFNEEF